MDTLPVNFYFVPLKTKPSFALGLADLKGA
jgi:hypothetical protein